MRWALSVPCQVSNPVCAIGVCALLEIDAEISELESALLEVGTPSFEELDYVGPATGAFANGVLGLESLHAVNASEIAAIVLNENPRLFKRIFPPCHSRDAFKYM